MIESCFFRKLSGFTLISLLITLLITAILAVSVMISYRAFIERHQLDVIADNLAGALRLGQSEAMVSGGNIHFCPCHVPRKQCGLDWRQGQCLLMGHQQLLRQYAVIPSRYRLFWRSRLGLNHQIDWDSNGFTVGQQGSFWLCAKQSGQNASARQIVLLQTGRVRIAQRDRCEPMI